MRDLSWIEIHRTFLAHSGSATLDSNRSTLARDCDQAVFAKAPARSCGWDCFCHSWPYRRGGCHLGYCSGWRLRRSSRVSKSAPSRSGCSSVLGRCEVLEFVPCASPLSSGWFEFSFFFPWARVFWERASFVSRNPHTSPRCRSMESSATITYVTRALFLYFLLALTIQNLTATF